MTRLVVRLVALQIALGAAVSFVIIAFAPRLLLLDPSIVEGSTPLLIWGGAVAAVVAVVAPFVVTRRVQPALRALAAGSGDVDPESLLAIYAVPAHLVVADMLGALALCLATLVRPIRPETNDLYTQTELAMLTMTMVSAAALPYYVMLRAQVARVLEQAPPVAAREAIEILRVQRRDSKRLRRRLFAATVAPVGFVALAASLLVHAHIRAFDASSREDDAQRLVSAVLEPINGRTTGRKEAAEAARAHGIDTEFFFSGAAASVVHNDQGETVVTQPISDGHVVLTFQTARVSPTIGIYVLLAILATAIAGFLGARLGAAFEEDVAMATQEVRVTGAHDVVRGTRIQRDARFISVGALRQAIDELGGVFREFGSAQERAIEARAATERMRGLFLAAMSHDLKAPLNATLGFAELVRREPLGDGQRESVTIIEQRGRELLHLIDTILDTARADAGELVITPELTRVGDVVMPAVLDARDLAAGLDVKIQGEIQPGVPRIWADPVRATQALTAIILVAVRFADHGIVHVRATLPEAGERLRIDTEATGRGLPLAERDRIFEAFKYPDRARRHGSLGLGPSLARAIIERHGGSVDVDATVGGGIVFRVWLVTER